jgi:hypothetical protein
LGHSYAVNPGSPATGAMLTTSSIVVRQRGHGRVLPPRLLLDRSDTIHTPFALGLIDLGSSIYRTLDEGVGCRRGLLFKRLGRPDAVPSLAAPSSI